MGRKRLAAILALGMAALVVAAPGHALTTWTLLLDDPMSRSVSPGWGNSPNGRAYVTDDDTRFSVSGSEGKMVVGKGEDRWALPNGVSAADVRMSASFKTSAIPTAGSMYFSLTAREQDNRDAYRLRVRIGTGGNAYLELVRIDGPTQAVTHLSPTVKLPFVATAGTPYRLSGEVTGSSPVTLNAKAWQVGTTEPAGWQMSATDTLDKDLAGPGKAGIWSYVSATGSDTILTVDDVSVSSASPNTAPTAAFTTTTNTSTVTVDGTGSRDPDGTIASYDWSFGDGRSATGAKPAAHSYSAGGTYTIALTVTDDDGATATVTKTVTVSGPPPGDPGARLPINYALSSLRGTVRYVATNGSDSSGNGTVTAPYATLPKAVSASASGDSIVIRGGTYELARNASYLDRANLAVVAYPGEIPIFDGSVAAPSATTAEGSLKYFRANLLPAALGEGVGLSNLPKATFSGTSPTGLAAARGWRCVGSGTSYSTPAPTTADPDGCATGTTARIVTGFYPEQVWLNGQSLVQVHDKSRVIPGTFYVARSATSDGAPGAGNFYLAASDAADMSKVRVSSSTGNFLQVAASGVRIEGMKIRNHSPAWNNYSVLVDAATSDVTLRDLAIEHVAGIAVKLAGGGTSGGGKLIRDATLDHLSLVDSGWSGAVFTFTDDTILSGTLISTANASAEFTGVPQVGGMKATKNDRMIVENSRVEGVTGPGLWWDQSNYQVTLADSVVRNNSETPVFFEISHGLTLVNNRITHTGKGAAVRLSASSGLRLVNNTVVGGEGQVSITNDPRSKKYGTSSRYCSEHTARYGQGGDFTADCSHYSSDLDTARPGAYGVVNKTPGMNWMPAVDVMINNVFANPTASGQCGALVSLCVAGYTDWLGVVTQVQLNTVFKSGIQMDGNVYQGSGKTAKFHTTTGQSGGFVATALADLRGTAGLGSSYYGLSVESRGKSATSGLVNSDGTQTATLQAANAQAAAVPTDPAINAFVPAGTRYYGAMG